MIMGKKSYLLAFIVLSQGVVWGNPHNEASDCRLSSALSEVCWNNCVICHERTDPIVPLEIYVNGDMELCARCHPHKSEQVAGANLLRFVSGGGGNHPVGILYSPDGSRTLLVPSPSGPKFFTDTNGNNPKIHCSSCHDSMASSANLLRVNNRGSALCLSCHRK